MREILFRGKRADNGNWIFGSLFTRINERYIIPLPLITSKSLVDPVTVGQYTGLTDKKGEKIFEGDIFRANNGINVCIAVVKFGEFYPKMFYKMLDMYCAGARHIPAKGFYAESVDKHEEMFLFQSPCVEVIGNIYDNPELLEVEK